MSDFSFVAVVDYLKINSQLGADWKITDELRISNSKTIAQNILTPFLETQIGRLESLDIVSGKPYVYAQLPYPPEVDTTDSSQTSFLNAYLSITQRFFNALWLHKDNSANFSLGFLQFPFRSKLASRVSSNGRNVRFTKADGTIGDTLISKSELTEVIESFHQFYGNPLAVNQFEHLTGGPRADDHRIARAFYFLDMARNAADLPEKIAFYCTCFETIVSTDPSELAHKVSERVAVMIASDPSEALEIYRLIKRAYDTRSKLIHGGFKVVPVI